MKRHGWHWFLLTWLIAAGSAREAKAQDGMPRTAFTVDARLGGGVGIDAMSFVIPSLTFGARFAGRVNLGLGASYAGIEGMPDARGDGTFVRFIPTLLVDAFKSRDEKMALYLKGALPIGFSSHSGGVRAGAFELGVDLGAGARYAFHRHFALGLEAGSLTYIHSPNSASETVFSSFYASLVVTAMVF